jgi:EpsI family protein
LPKAAKSALPDVTNETSRTQTDDEASPATLAQELRTSQFAKNVWIAVAAIVLVQGTVVAIERSFAPSAVRPLRRPLSDLPFAIGAWSGKDTVLDPRTFIAVGSDQQINRMYRNPAGDEIAVHCACWITSDDWVPHPPEQCYTANGWELLQTRTMALPNRPDVQIALQDYQRAGSHLAVAYWYEMDEQTFIDREGARAARRTQWGRRMWSPVIKTLLQTGQTPDADSRLLGIAGQIYEFNRNL